ncbi:hypothetical protein Ocin01_16933 [Orchesella cincta]|uniref:Uncharacterized protein n=1 Tax=Orchesella cincta TaxID=48709 RepID=A0A1D2M9U1_ORCCI|nr:hypothetical protein Ocin01_16933 [Orchesella cincta]
MGGCPPSKSKGRRPLQSSPEGLRSLRKRCLLRSRFLIRKPTGIRVTGRSWKINGLFFVKTGGESNDVRDEDRRKFSNRRRHSSPFLLSPIPSSDQIFGEHWNFSRCLINIKSQVVALAVDTLIEKWIWLSPPSS